MISNLILYRTAFKSTLLKWVALLRMEISFGTCCKGFHSQIKIKCVMKNVNFIPIKIIYFKWEANHYIFIQNGIVIPVHLKSFRVYDCQESAVWSIKATAVHAVYTLNPDWWQSSGHRLLSILFIWLILTTFYFYWTCLLIQRIAP